MKPRVEACTVISTSDGRSDGWDVIIDDEFHQCYRTWQDAMDAAIRWFNEHHFVVQDRQGYWWFFNREYGLLNTGTTKKDAIRRAQATPKRLDMDALVQLSLDVRAAKANPTPAARPTNHTQGETP